MNIDPSALRALASGFRSAFDDFQSFEVPGEAYVQGERGYKDELRGRFDQLFGPLLADGGGDAQWFDALLELLTSKLEATSEPQNLVGWRFLAILNAFSAEGKELGGAAIRGLLTGAGAPWARFGDFSESWRSIHLIDGKPAAPAFARDIGTLLLALQDPLSACPVRYDVFDKASKALTGRSLFAGNPEPAEELRSCLAFANAVFVALRDQEQLAPRDLLDVQGFLWVAFKYGGEGMSYGDLFRNALQQFEQARTGPFGEKRELWDAMDALQARIAASPPVEARPNVIVKWSLGKGKWATIPWIALLDQRLTNSIQEGVYVVLLVSEDLSRVFLTLNQGMAKLVDELGQPEAVKAMEATAAEIRAHLSEVERAGFTLGSDLDLKTTAWRAKNYQAGAIAYLEYRLDDFPEDQEFEHGLEVLLKAYGEMADGPPSGSRPGWFVGAVWDGDDKSEEFLEEGVWRNGYDSGPTLDEVRQVRPGDRIAIKAAFTQRNNLPFPYPSGGTVSVMRIKAVGTVVENPGDGRTLGVEWDREHTPRDWYFYTNRETVWAVRPGSAEAADQLLAFAFDGAEQDYDWFLRQPYWKKQAEALAQAEADPFTVDDAMNGLFMERSEFERILSVWRGKKNLVLQGAPGVGKSFVARRLAYALMGFKDERRVASIQFHQSYGYEDFIQGYRPTEAGGFALKDGVFHRVCEAARADPDRPYVFIIDEINRGNLSKIFGELMLLIESDKRSEAWALQLAYADEKAPPFYVPDNVFLLGMMNTADRSLSLVDYALRRRFAFIGLEPGFKSEAFGPHLSANGVGDGVVRRIISGMAALNEEIAADTTNLGPGFQIGHSFFTPTGPVASAEHWFETVVETEIRPLLEEYWFDEPAKAATWRERLLSS